MKIERRLLFSFNWLEPFGFVLYMVIIVPSMVFSTCVQVVAVTIVILQLAWHITLKSWSLMFSSDTVLLTSSSVFVSPFLYFTVVFKLTKLSSIPSFTVWLPVDEPKHKSPLTSSSLSLSRSPLQLFPLGLTHNSGTLDIPAYIDWSVPEHLAVHCVGKDKFHERP